MSVQQVNSDTDHSTVHRSARNSILSVTTAQALLETILIVVLMAMFAGQLPPDVNESHYLTKAKHFWNPDWCPDDLFLGSAFAHFLFYAAFGWITRFVSLDLFAWIGRWLVWVCLAAAWRSTSWKLVPIPFVATISSVLFLILNDRFHLAGEWVVGGFEAKGLAYALVIYALGFVVTGKWNRAWPLLGLAAAFHVLVGGWAVLATLLSRMVAMMGDRNTRSVRGQLKRELPGLLLGVVLGLAGALPPLMANQSAEMIDANAANRIYVNQRIAHHLLFEAFPTMHVARFAGLILAWLAVFAWCRQAWPAYRQRLAMLFWFAMGSLLISFGGLMLNALMSNDESQTDFAASLLRFYWFRLSDFAVPAALSLAIALTLGNWLIGKSTVVHRALAILGCVSIGLAFSLTVTGKYDDPRPVADQRSLPTYLANPTRTLQTYENWVRVCRWISENTPPDAVFFTPADQQTFKWYAGRTEVVNWKDIPQDAESIVIWRQRVAELLEPQKRSEWGLLTYSDAQLQFLADRYDADYLVVPQRAVDLAPTPTRLKQVYPEDRSTKSTYVVFQF